jgi:NADH:ubiquinone oxidoreductase subunit E
MSKSARKSPLVHRTQLVAICYGDDCKKRGAKALVSAAEAHTKATGVKRERLVVKTKCTGHCKQAPVVTVQPLNIWLANATPESLVDALDEASRLS